MPERYKTALSRSRVFELDSTVVFCGEYKKTFDLPRACKALEKLCLKEPVITSKIELCQTGEAFIVTDAFSQQIEASKLAKSDILRGFDVKPIRFYEKLFHFILSADGYLVIAAHTAVCDAKSLLRLASYFTLYYEGEEISVDGNKIFTFSEPKSLPVDVISPLTKKLSAELDNKWHKLSRVYTQADYDKACEKYFEGRSKVDCIEACFSEDEINELREQCNESGVDLSSLVYYSFYKSILDNCSVNRASSKMRIYADRRFFHGKDDIYSVGAYNGTVNVGLNKRELKKTQTEQIKAFHLDAYRALTSAFRVFYDDVLFMQIDPALCDSSFISLAGTEKNKVSKDFAQTHGCESRQLCDCLYCNLNQLYWSPLSEWRDVSVCEPFKARSDKMLSFTETADGGKLVFKYDTKYTNSASADVIVKNAISTLKSYKIN